MSTPSHRRAREALVEWDAPTVAQDRLRAAYLTHLDDYPDALTKSCYPAHLTASVAVLNESRTATLLTLHRKAGKWFQFGGHIEPNDVDLGAAALREGIEESGLPAADLRAGWHPHPVHLSRHPVDFCHSHGSVDHLDVRYLAVVPDDARPQVSAESVDVRWWPVAALPTDEPDVTDLIDLALLVSR